MSFPAMGVPISTAPCTREHRPDDDGLHPSRCDHDPAPVSTGMEDSPRAANSDMAGLLMDPRASLPSVAPRVVVMLCLCMPS